MSTAWAHLPNARHIDGILADAKARPEAWEVAWTPASWGADSGRAWDIARQIAGPTERGFAEVWDAARNLTGYGEAKTVWDAVTDPLAALLAWPDSARMLYMTPAALRTLIDITEGDVKNQAVLILPAVLAGYVPTEGDYQWT